MDVTYLFISASFTVNYFLKTRAPLDALLFNEDRRLWTKYITTFDNYWSNTLLLLTFHYLLL